MSPWSWVSECWMDEFSIFCFRHALHCRVRRCHGGQDQKRTYCLCNYLHDPRECYLDWFLFRSGEQYVYVESPRQGAPKMDGMDVGKSGKGWAHAQKDATVVHLAFDRAHWRVYPAESYWYVGKSRLSISRRNPRPWVALVSQVSRYAL